MKTLSPLMVVISVATGLVAPLSAQTAHLVASFDYANGELPESLAIDHDGNAFLSIVYGGKIVEVAPDGTKSDFATIPDGQLLGVKFDPAGNLCVAGGSGIWKVSRTGDVSLFASVPGHFYLNDIAFDRAGDMYVTDSFAYSIWKIDAAGNAVIWNTDPLLLPESSFFPWPLGPNGLAFSRDGRTLFVLNTAAGRIVAIGIGCDGSPQPAVVLAEDDALIGADGMTLDACGNLIVAVNIQNQIIAVSPHGELTEIASGGLLSTPTSVAFGDGRARGTLFICNNGDFFPGADATKAGLLSLVVGPSLRGRSPVCHRPRMMTSH